MSVKDVYYIGNHTVTRPDKNFTHFLEYMHYILYIAIATYIITIYIYISYNSIFVHAWFLYRPCMSN